MEFYGSSFRRVEKKIWQPYSEEIWLDYLGITYKNQKWGNKVRVENFQKRAVPALSFYRLLCPIATTNSEARGQQQQQTNKPGNETLFTSY